MLHIDLWQGWMSQLCKQYDYRTQLCKKAETHHVGEIIYTQPTVDKGSLSEISLQSGVLGLDMVSYGDWPPGALWGNSLQWPLAGKQKWQRYKAVKITEWYDQEKKKKLQVNMAVFDSLCLTNTLRQLRPLSRNKMRELDFFKEKSYGHSSSISFHHSSRLYNIRIIDKLIHFYLEPIIIIKWNKMHIYWMLYISFNKYRSISFKTQLCFFISLV